MLLSADCETTTSVFYNLDILKTGAQKVRTRHARAARENVSLSLQHNGHIYRPVREAGFIRVYNIQAQLRVFHARFPIVYDRIFCIGRKHANELACHYEDHFVPLMARLPQIEIHCPKTLNM